VHGIGAVGKAEVDDRRRRAHRGRIAPQQIRGVQIVVRPQRLKRVQQRQKLA
jgi:hypothetical protein